MWTLLVGLSLAAQPGVGKLYCYQEVAAAGGGDSRVVAVPKDLSFDLGFAENARRMACTEARGTMYRSAFEEDYTPGEVALLLMADGLVHWDVNGRKHDITELASMTADRMRFVEALDRSAVLAELGAAEVPKAWQKVFLSKLDLAARRIRDSYAALDDAQRMIFAEPIDAAVKEGRAMRSVVEGARPAAESWIGKADAALLDKSASRALLNEGMALRLGWVQTCSAAGRPEAHCVSDEIGRPLTRKILALAAALKDAPLAHAEQMLWREMPDQSDTRYAIVQAVLAAKDRARGLDAARREAVRNGVDTAEIERRFGPPIDQRWLDDGAYITAGAHPPSEDLPRVDSLRVERIERDISRIDVRGDKVTLSFAYRTWTSTYGTGCHETNKVIGYDTSGGYGRVIYETVCTGPDQTVRENDKVAPVTMSAAEARGLTADMHVVVLTAAGSEGRVLEARDAKGRVVARHGFQATR